MYNSTYFFFLGAKRVAWPPPRDSEDFVPEAPVNAQVIYNNFISNRFSIYTHDSNPIMIFPNSTRLTFASTLSFLKIKAMFLFFLIRAVFRIPLHPAYRTITLQILTSVGVRYPLLTSKPTSR